jgi:uncharacterized phage-associated protein
VSAALDVALWFLDRARAADGHLPAQKLQNLLYLACAHFERENDGRPLMPAVFVANEVTVADPNLYRLLEEGRPRVRVEPVPTVIDAFLSAVWKRYGHSTVEHLNAVVRRALDVETSGKQELDGGVLAPSEETSLLKTDATLLRADAALLKDPQPLRPTHRGRQVVVAPWCPPSIAKK